MYEWNTRTASSSIILLMILAILHVGSLSADPWVCTEDLNSDGDLDDVGESLDCETGGLGLLCPINKASCANQNQCTQTPTTINFRVAGNTTGGLSLTFQLTDASNFSASGNITDVNYNTVQIADVCDHGHDISFVGSAPWSNPPGYSGSVETGATMSVTQIPNCSNNFVGIVQLDDNDNDINTFLAATFSFSTVVEQCSNTDVCPMGNYPCIDVGNGPECSANNCFDLGATNVIETGGPSGDMYVDDGGRDANGNCQGVTMIFSGRAMTCQPPGKSNAYQNCCHNSSGEIYFDSTGSTVENALTNKAITATAQAAYAAYEAYSAAQAAGASSQAASQAATTAASDSLTVAFDPASLAIAFAIQLVLDYVMQACPQMDMETAMLNSSGYCIEVGEYCKTEWEFVGCVQEERSYCCFNSKLARIIQEQGRPQLPSMGGFGTPENPECRGFLPYEFQALDFSRIDFSEYYNDLRHETQAVMENAINDGINSFYEQTQTATP